MRGVLSLWTRPPKFHVARGPLLITTLAVCLANRAFAEVEFVTDLRGARLAAALGWQFGSVNLALESFAPAELEHVWALGKLAALREQTVPCVQFDSDVLLFQPLPAALTSAPLLAQSPDWPAYYTGEKMARAMSVCSIAEGGVAYNAGIIGGADVALVRDYACEALAHAEALRGCDLSGTSLSMFVEQYFFGAFARARGVAVGTLLPLAPTREEVTRAGYAHLMGGAKRDPFYLARAEARLARDFPEAHARFVAGWAAKF